MTLSLEGLEKLWQLIDSWLWGRRGGRGFDYLVKQCQQPNTRKALNTQFTTMQTGSKNGTTSSPVYNCILCLHYLSIDHNIHFCKGEDTVRGSISLCSVSSFGLPTYICHHLSWFDKPPCPQNDDVICEQPLIAKYTWTAPCTNCTYFLAIVKDENIWKTIISHHENYYYYTMHCTYKF